MKLLNNFINYIKKEHLFNPKDQLIIAVSGGLDSIVLTRLCIQSGFKISIAHCNFQLRGAESEGDEQFVRSLAAKYGVELFVHKFDASQYAADNKVSIQVAARELRYGWFAELAEKMNACILTAHHADDNVETLLMNFFKGTGINGLKAMSPKNGKVIRPLLFANKADLLQFATYHKLDHVEDSSNEENKYTRNYFRNQLIPGIAKVFPQVEKNLAANINRFAEVNILYSQAINNHIKKLIEVKGNEVHIPILKLQKAVPLNTILFEIIKTYSFSFSQVGEVIQLFKSESGKYVSSSTHRVIRNRNWLLITPVDNTIAANIIIDNEQDAIIFQEGALSFKNVSVSNNFKPSTESTLAILDRSTIHFPLLLRKWKQGDYFYPLGMSKKKKLSRFFIDQKMSLAQKERTWVLEMDKKIVWVVGIRIDNRFKITPSTNECLEIRISS